ncbi:MAG: Peptidase [Candidatus Tokpelaia hoelldobleri]|uniref:Peptidase n=1 Tax=Candidatus Tokpelaia hoelldobleri TaxID=1902579 RepID=A0A1U9JTU6_9HYPH|nr:MAG: Peptidase [Candidatus Tokpelaia hoelldoblerii]
MNFEVSKIKHIKEKIYEPITLIVGILIWLWFLLAVLESPAHSIIFTLVFYILIFLFISFVSRVMMRAYIFGHYVLVGERQFPHIHQMVVDASRRVGLKEVPKTFIFNSNGVMNAMAVRLLGRTKYVWLTSALIDADNDEQIRFVIGHELGHHVAGHLDILVSILRFPAKMVPFLGAAYSRSRELTCDRIGIWLSGDIEASRTALQMLACGSARLNAQMNATVFQEQENMVPPITGFFLHIFSGYPRLTQRVAEITEWYAYSKSTSPVFRIPGETALS